MYGSPMLYSILYFLCLAAIAVILGAVPLPRRRKEFPEKWQAYNLAWSLAHRGQTVSYILMHSTNKTFLVSDSPKLDGYVCIDRVQSMTYNMGR